MREGMKEQEQNIGLSNIAAKSTRGHGPVNAYLNGMNSFYSQVEMASRLCLYTEISRLLQCRGGSLKDSTINEQDT